MNKFIFALTGFGLLSLSVSPTPVLAADDVDTFSAQSPIEIVITAGRKQQAVSDALAATSVVTRETLEQSQAQTLGEVLTRLPGISLANSGGVGKQTSVYLRGTESDHVLVLVDGVKVGSATLGSTAFEQLPLSQIERIEVVRGPRSSLYGSEAIGGVIQIFTRQGGKQGFTPRASMSYGSNNTRQADVNLSGGNGASWFNLSAATEHTDGFNALDFYYDFGTGGNVTEGDDDGFKSNSFSLRAGHDFGAGMKLEFMALRSESENEYDGNPNESDGTQQVGSLKLTAPVTTNTVLTAQIGQSRDETEGFKDGVPYAFGGVFNTKRDTAGLQAETKIGDSSGTLVYGFDYQDDQVSGSTNYDVSSRDNKGLFFSYENQFGANALAASVRQDDNEQFGDQTTGSVALGHKLDNGIQLRATYGTAFKAPTFNDLYFPTSSSFAGNPGLKPENSKTAELGVSGQLAQGNWAVSIFDMRVDNLISYVYNAETRFGTMENVDEAKMQGIELEVATRVADWRLSANTTYQKTENLSGFNKGKRLLRRPEKLLNLNVDRRFGPVDLGVTVRAEGARYMDGANADRLGGFTTVDLRGKYQIVKDWTVSAKIGNLLDKEYETVRNYNQDGVNGLITLEYQPR